MRTLLPAASLWLIASAALLANPTGGVVANGSASIAGQGTASVLVTQGSDRAVINWQTFSIGSGELTKFIQPSSTSAALNRVLGGQTSFINGTLSANGQIFLINGNGIVVGPGGVISTAGFTGSTRDIADSDFMANNLHFVGSGDAGVKNLGTISALGGDVVLIGKTVANRGTIKATGTAALVAGDDVLLAQKNADGSTVTVNPVSSPTAAKGKVGVKNTGLIEASSAELKAANGNIYALAIQNEGMVQATNVTQQGGHIYLTSDTGTIVNSGTLNASATAAGGTGGTVLVKSAAGKVVQSGSIVARGGTGGQGGNAEISAPVVNFTGTVDLRADGGATGNLLLDPSTLTVVSGYGGSVVGDDDSGNDINGTGSTIGAQTVDDALNETNLTLNADNGITINAEIDWTSGNTLTLSTNVSGSTIAINAPINGPSGSLALNAAAATDVISTTLNGTISVNNFYLQSGAWFQLVNDGSGNGGDLPQTYVTNVGYENILPSFTVTGDFEIGNGATFLRADSGNGTTVYYGLEDIYGVQGMNGFLNSNFTLNGLDLDASVTANWNPTTVGDSTVNEGFVPIGLNSEGGFQGVLDYGYIYDLTINRPDTNNVGLISSLNGVVHDFELDNSTIQGANNVGTLVGKNEGELDNVNFYACSVTGVNDVGGIVGFQGNGYLDDFGTQIHTNSSSFNDGTVTGQSYVGGLIGENKGQIDGVGVTSVTVTGNSYVGGIAGSNDYVSEGPTPTLTYATFSGTVTYDDTNGESYALGGIVGENDGVVQYCNTYPGATVTGDYDIGGIAGFNTGVIEDSYNSAAVSGASNDYEFGDAYIGGIAGENGGLQNDENSNFVSNDDDDEGPSILQYGTIQTSYNTGAISGGSYVGGLVGSNDYASNLVTTAYNVGSVTGGDHVGGIVGDNNGTVEYVYNSGPVSGDDTGTTGALIGFDEDGATTQDSYWDTSTSVVQTATNYNSDDDNAATENEIGTVSTSAEAEDSAYAPSSYSYFGASTPESDVSDLINNGVYELGTLPSGDASTANSSYGWFILPGETRPILTMEFTGNIQNPHELQLIATDLGGDFDVTQPVDVSAVTNLSEVWTSAGFSPIGGLDEGASAFTGYFNGNGETLSSLYINRPDSSSVGLFGASDGTVTNVNLNDAAVTGSEYVGGLVGTNYGTVSYVQNNNDGAGEISGGLAVGGLVGMNEGTITYAQNNGPVTGSYSVGGIAGYNYAPEDVVGESFNTGTITATGEGPSAIGGIVGTNYGQVTQSYNTGNVGESGDTMVGGLVGQNEGQVDDSYSGGGSGAGTIMGDSDVGGLVGENDGTLETSYSTSTVDSDTSTAGYLVGDNFGSVLHTYWDTETVGTSASAGIGTNETDSGATAVDVAGYTTAQLSDASNFAQGDEPTLWNFNPSGTNDPGPWGINVYEANYQYNDESYQLVTSQLNDGLPVLQWQTPVNVAVSATSGTQNYGYAPSYTVTGSGAAQFASYVPGGATVEATGGNQAGDVDHLTVAPTTILDSNYTAEFLDSAVTIVPAPLYIVADSYVVPVGGATPSFGAVYTGLVNGDTSSSLTGTLDFSVPPDATATAALYSILVSGQSSLNYVIHYIPGTLDVYSPKTSSPQSQPVLTAQAEVNTIEDSFANDPANGLDPIYFLVIPTQFGLGGDLLGAVNNEPHKGDYAYASSTSGLPAFSRLVLPETGVVQIVDGAVVVGSPETGKPIFLSNPGGFLPSGVVSNFQSVLSPAAYAQLLALINGQ